MAFGKRVGGGEFTFVIQGDKVVVDIKGGARFGLTGESEGLLGGTEKLSIGSGRGDVKFGGVLVKNDGKLV